MSGAVMLPMSHAQARRERARARIGLPLFADGMACPACAGRHFEVGRSSAECVRCGLPLPLSAG